AAEATKAVTDRRSPRPAGCREGCRCEAAPKARLRRMPHTSQGGPRAPTEQMRPYRQPNLATVPALDEEIRDRAQRERRGHQYERQRRAEWPIVEARELVVDQRAHHLKSWPAQQDRR